MFASRIAIDAATIDGGVAARSKPPVVTAIVRRIGKFFDRVVTGSGQNLSGPNRKLSHEYLRFPPF